MKEELIVKAYEIAQERYASIGIDTENGPVGRVCELVKLVSYV